MNEKIFWYLTLLFLFNLASSLPVEDKLSIKRVFQKRAVDITPFAHYPRPEGCSSPPNAVSVGLHMDLYNYPYLYVKNPRSGFTNDTESNADGETDGDSAGGIEGRAGQCWNPEYQDPNFPRYGYKKYGSFGSSDHVNGEISWDHNEFREGCKPIMARLPTAYNYPAKITFSNFTMVLSGYFKPKSTGLYKFEIHADDFILFNFGSKNAFECCNREESIDNFGPYVAYAMWPNEADQELEVYLFEDSYYPIRLFYNNRDYHSKFMVGFYPPNTEEITYDFDGYLYMLDDTGNECKDSIRYKTVCDDDVVDDTTFSTQYSTIMEPGGGTEVITIYYIRMKCEEEDCIGQWDPINNICYTPEDCANDGGYWNGDMCDQSCKMEGGIVNPDTGDCDKSCIESGGFLDENGNCDTTCRDDGGMLVEGQCDYQCKEAGGILVGDHCDTTCVDSGGKLNEDGTCDHSCRDQGGQLDENGECDTSCKDSGGMLIEGECDTSCKDEGGQLDENNECDTHCKDQGGIIDENGNCDTSCKDSGGKLDENGACDTSCRDEGGIIDENGNCNTTCRDDGGIIVGDHCDTSCRDAGGILIEDHCDTTCRDSGGK
ncbi:Flocculation protein FLO10, partial [Nakaseomyces glabratus]